MKQYILIIADDGTPSLAPYSATTPTPTPTPTTKRASWNVPKIADYHPAWLSNMALQGRAWVDTAKAGWPAAPGAPLTMTAGSAPAMILCWDTGALTWPAGTYTATASGATVQIKTQKTGEVLWSTASPAETFSFDPVKHGGLMAVLLSPGDLRLSVRPSTWMGVTSPGFRDATKGSGEGVLRFMDAQRINDSEESDSVVPAGALSWATRGIPPEGIAEVCKEASMHAWVCIPHKATTEYVRTFARRLKAAMPAWAKVYVEFSNELWNGQFAQARFFGSSYATAAPVYNARAASLINIFKAEYGASCIRVMASQSANYGTASDALKTAQANGGCDVLAIAPYFGHDIRVAADFTTTKVAAAVDKAIQEMRDNLAIARSQGVGLVAYEGGMHCIGITEEQAYGTLMATETARYLGMWNSLVGGQPFCYYNLADLGGPSGYWGATRNLAYLSNPRYQAVVKAAA